MAQEFRLDMVADADPVQIASRRCVLAFSRALRLTRYVCRLRQSVPAETGVVSMPRSWSRGEKTSREDVTGRGCTDLAQEDTGQSGGPLQVRGGHTKQPKTWPGRKERHRWVCREETWEEESIDHLIATGLHRLPVSFLVPVFLRLRSTTGTGQAPEDRLQLSAQQSRTLVMHLYRPQ